MELWIRSQDKYTLLKCNNKITIIDGTGMKEALDKSLFSALAQMEQLKSLKDGWCLSIDDLILGTYKSKERALEVLDEIQKRILNLQLVSLEERGKARGDAKRLSYLECVYELPED